MVGPPSYEKQVDKVCFKATEDGQTVVMNEQYKIFYPSDMADSPTIQSVELQIKHRSADEPLYTKTIFKGKRTAPFHH